jgi:hypothetical protein
MSPLSFNMDGGSSEDTFGLSDIHTSENSSSISSIQQGGGQSAQGGGQSTQGGQSDVKQVTFTANDKELSSMGL